MKVRSFMVADPITITEQASIQSAIAVMKENRIRHLPMVDRQRRLVGWVTLSDLKQGLFPSMMGEFSMEDLINRNPLVVSPEDDMEVAANLIYKHKISGLPVVQDGALVGVITETDLLRTFIDMMGLLTPSSRVDVMLGDSPGALRRALACIQEGGGDIISIGHALGEGNRRICFFRLQPCETAKIRALLESDGFQVLETLD